VTGVNIVLKNLFEKIMADKNNDFLTRHRDFDSKSFHQITLFQITCHG